MVFTKKQTKKCSFGPDLFGSLAENSVRDLIALGGATIRSRPRESVEELHCTGQRTHGSKVKSSASGSLL